MQIRLYVSDCRNLSVHIRLNISACTHSSVRSHLEGGLQGCDGVTSLGDLVEADRCIGKLNEQKDRHVGPILDTGLDDGSHPNHDGHGLP